MKPESDKLDELLRAAMGDLHFAAGNLNHAATRTRKHRAAVQAAHTLVLAARGAVAKALKKLEAPHER